MHKTILMLACLCCGIASKALAVKVADVTRVGGQRPNFIHGQGLVVGLKGTGDGNKPLTLKLLREMLARFDHPIDLRELGGADSVAMVHVQARIPINGAREGEELDVYISPLQGASSLQGGRLLVTPMQGPI